MKRIVLLLCAVFFVTSFAWAIVGAPRDEIVSSLPRVEVTATSTLNPGMVMRTIVTNYGMAAGGDTTLPAYVGSTSFQVLTEAATQSWSLKPPTGEAFVLDGTALDANDEIDIGQTVGDCATLLRIRTGASTYQWYFYSIQGTHSDGGQS